MALSEFEIKRMEKLVGQFLEKKRPPAHTRDQVDFTYKIVNQSFELYEVRPKWNDPSVKIETGLAKATYVKSKKVWKLYWMRADMKWHSYEPSPILNRLEDVLEVIDIDTHCCFWG